MKKDQIELEEDVTMEQVHMYRQKYPILTEGEIILSIIENTPEQTKSLVNAV